MESSRRSPRDIARRMAEKTTKLKAADGGSWRRATYKLPRGEAREKAQEWFDRFPKAAYMTEIEFWRELENDVIEFTIRRLPSSD
jgi:hypothetical protein